MGKIDSDSSEIILEFQKTFLDMLDLVYNGFGKKNFSLEHFYEEHASKIYEHLCNPPIDAKNSVYIIISEAYEAFTFFKKASRQENDTIEKKQYLDYCDFTIYAIFIRILNSIETEKNPLREAIQLEMADHLNSVPKTEIELFMRLLYVDILFDSLRASRYFCPEIFTGLTKCLEYLCSMLEKAKFKNYKKAPEAKGILKEWFQEQITPSKNSAKKGEYDLVYAFVAEVCAKFNTLYMISTAESNCDLHLEQIMEGLKTIAKYVAPVSFLSQTVNSTEEKLKFLVNESSLKGNLDLIRDRPIVKIKQLIPKYDEKQINKEEEKVSEKRRLKRNLQKTQKRAIKDIKRDNLAIQMEKQKADKLQFEQKKDYEKKYMKVMEEQQKEIKRIETTQLQHKERRKIKKHRMAGNQMADEVQGSKKVKK